MDRLRGEFFPNRNAYVAAHEPGIFHCHHYNTYLQAVILDAEDYTPGIRQLLSDMAQEISYTQMSNAFKNNQLGESEKKRIAEDYYRFCGFGKIDLSAIDNHGGVVKAENDHYGIGWKVKFGNAKNPVSHFSAGYLAGVTEALYELKMGSLVSSQTKCIAMGDDYSEFTITESNNGRSLSSSQQEGKFQESSLVNPTETSVDYVAIRNALTSMPIEGHQDNGLIEAFDVILTRHYSNYYCNISYGFLELLTKHMGDDGRLTAVELLTEAGHVCAFNTFGGVMQSNEWNGLIKPMTSSKEDWVHGIVAVINAFGWGFWEIEELDPGKKLVLNVRSGYESNSYLDRYGKSEYPISFLATGGTAGIMNLIYTLNLPEKTPLTLDEQAYAEIHRSSQFFVARQTRCRAMGDGYDQFIATIR